MREKTHQTRRTVLAATGALSVAGMAGLAAGSTSDTSVPIPDNAEAYDYPTMGITSDAPTAKVYGNYKCPYTAELAFGNLSAIIEEYVATGQLNLQFRNLAYEVGDTSQYFLSDSDPRLAAVGLAIWNEDPQSYWQFNFDTLENMPEGSVSYDELESRARSAGVSNAGEVVSQAQSGAYDGAVEQIASEAAADDISFTPMLALGGDATAPHHGEQEILDWIDQRIDSAPVEPASNYESNESDTELPEDSGGNRSGDDCEEDDESVSDRWDDCDDAGGSAWNDCDDETDNSIGEKWGESDESETESSNGGGSDWLDSSSDSDDIECPYS